MSGNFMKAGSIYLEVCSQQHLQAYPALAVLWKEGMPAIQSAPLECFLVCHILLLSNPNWENIYSVGQV